MKGVQGIILAAIFGIVGAICNWAYIYRQAQEYDTVSFVKIARGSRLNRGDRFKETDLEELKVPEKNLGNLQDVAVLWRDRGDIIGQIAARTYSEADIILREAATKPGVKDFAELLNADDVAFSIPVDSRTFVTERVNPGNMVSFALPTFAPSEEKEKNPKPGGETKIFGPFKILALGTRLGDKQTVIAAGKSAGPENVITIGVPYKEGANGKKHLPEEVDEMLKLIRLNGNKNVHVMIHSSQAVKKIAPAKGA